MPLPRVGPRRVKIRRALDKSGVSVEVEPLYQTSSHFSKTPVEVIGLIFEQAASPVVLSHVCRHWRAVALKMSSLWINIFIRLPRISSPERFMIEVYRIQEYLARSKSRLLDISLNVTAAKLSRQQIHIVECLTPAIGRWRNLTIQTNLEIQASRISQILADKYAPNLQSVTVRLDCPLRDNPLIRVEHAVFKGGAPRLSRVSLNVSSLRFFLPTLDNVTTLQLSAEVYQPPCFSFPDFCTVLSLPSLTALSLRQNICEAPTDPSILQGLILPRLRHLKLDGSIIITNLLMHLRAPNLESLIIKDVDLGSGRDNGEPEYPMDPASCFPALKYLTLSGADPTSPWSVIPVARITRSIEHLVISNYTFCVLYDVDWTNETTGFWPNLRSITACCDCTYGFNKRTREDGGGDFADPGYFLKGAKTRQGMTYRLLPETLSGMLFNDGEGLRELMAGCSVEEITTPSAFIEAEWPPMES